MPWINVYMSLPLQPQRSSTRTSLRVRDGFREIGHDLKEGIHNAQETIKRRMSISMDTHSQQKKKPKRNRNRTLSMIAVGAVDKVLGRASPRHFGSEDDGSRDRR